MYCVRHMGNTSPDGGKIDYDLMYNHTNGFQDFVETFEQRFQEQHELKDHWELFFQVLKDQGSWWDKIVFKIPELFVNADSWKEILQANFIRNLSALIKNPPQTIKNYEEHQLKIHLKLLKTMKSIKPRLIVGCWKGKSYYLLLIHKVISLLTLHIPIQQARYQVIQ